MLIYCNNCTRLHNSSILVWILKLILFLCFSVESLTSLILKYWYLAAASPHIAALSDPINALIIWCRGTQATAPIQSNGSIWAHSSAWGNQKQGLVACAQYWSEVLKLIPTCKVLLAHLALWGIVEIRWLPQTAFFLPFVLQPCVM